MKKILALLLAVIAGAPALALAEGGQTIAQLTTVAAALEAQAVSLSSGQPLACAVQFSAPRARVGQQVVIAWGSVGALDPLASSSSRPMWSRNGDAILLFDKAGTWNYHFTFYDASGASATCSAKILVTK